MQNIRIETDARGVARLIIDRPEKHNAMSGQMIEDLHKSALELGADSGVRVVVLASAGKTFCAGADLGWMRDQMAADRETRRSEATKLASMLGAFDALPKPLIGAVQGNAFGGGVGLISVCDVAIASETAMLGLTETRLGLIPATIGPYVIARMGAAKARRVFFSARAFPASEAVAMDLLARAVPQAALADAIEAEISPYLKTAPGAVAEAKALARHLGHRVTDDDIAHSVNALIGRWESDEAKDGIAAFFDKTAPPWA